MIALRQLQFVDVEFTVLRRQGNHRFGKLATGGAVAAGIVKNPPAVRAAIQLLNHRPDHAGDVGGGRRRAQQAAAQCDIFAALEALEELHKR